jgi:hypothetical protein
MTFVSATDLKNLTTFEPNPLGVVENLTNLKIKGKNYFAVANYNKCIS